MAASKQQEAKKMVQNPNQQKPPIPNEVKVGNSPIFTVLEKLGQGGYGAVYKGIRKVARHNSKCPDEVAIKFEFCKEKPDEWKFCTALQGVKGIPKVYYKGKCGECYITIMELLGPSLKTKWYKDVKKNRSEEESNRWLMAKVVQCIDILRGIHERGIIHGDVKPENIVMGSPGTLEEGKKYFIDFGLCYKYRMGKAHAKYDQDLGRFHGTTKYASVNAHLGRIQTRRDDLESLAYGLAYLLNGYVHWSGMDKHYQVGKKKMQVPPEILMGCMKSPFKHFFQLVIDLKFQEDPDYEPMKSIFRMKLQDPEKTVTHIDLTQNNFDKRFVLGRDVSQWVCIWTEKYYPMEQVFRLDVREGELERVVNKLYDEKFLVSKVVYSRGCWNLVCNRFSNKYLEQIWFFSDNLMPTELLSKYSKEGYGVTAVACCPDKKRGLFFMAKGLGCGDERYHVQNEFPYAWICEKWKTGYHITSMCSSLDGEKWVVVMASGAGYAEQVIEFDFIYPSEGIDKRWEQGYHISCAAGNSYGCVFVFSRSRQGKKMLAPPFQKSMRTCDLGNSIDKHKERLCKYYVGALCFGRTIC